MLEHLFITYEALDSSPNTDIHTHMHTHACTHTGERIACHLYIPREYRMPYRTM